MKKIILIDDDVSQLNRYKQQLELNDDVEISTFSSIEKLAESIVDLNEYDVIICDYNLGYKNENGLTFLKHISDDFKGKMALLTGEGNFSIRKDTWFKKIDYIEKSIDVVDTIESKYID